MKGLRAKKEKIAKDRLKEKEGEIAKGEVLNLTWDKVDMRERTIRLDPGETKNEEARTIYMNEELRKEMHSLNAKRPLGCPYVFHHAAAYQKV